MVILFKERFVFCELLFIYIGLDYFGLINVKRGRVIEKRWGCIFICFIICVVYLELVGDFIIDLFIMVLRRFCGRRGNFKMICLDNGSNFVGVERELVEVLRLLN